MPLPLNIVIDRTAGGRLRAEILGASIEAGTVAELLGAIEHEVTEALMETQDGAESYDNDEAERQARREIEKNTLSTAELDELIARYPVPQAWYDEPDWDDDSE